MVLVGHALNVKVTVMLPQRTLKMTNVRELLYALQEAQMRLYLDVLKLSQD